MEAHYLASSSAGLVAGWSIGWDEERMALTEWSRRTHLVIVHHILVLHAVHAIHGMRTAEHLLLAHLLLLLPLLSLPLLEPLPGLLRRILHPLHLQALSIERL